MRDETTSLLYLLAGSRLSASEIRGICDWISRNDTRDIVSMVSTIRGQGMAPISPVNDPMMSNKKTEAPLWPDVGADSQIKFEIARVLRSEAGLSVRNAAMRLTAEVSKELGVDLGSDPSGTNGLPTYGKESFDRFLSKLLRCVSPQVLLHIAHRIRDETVHAPTSAWPLHR